MLGVCKLLVATAAWLYPHIRATSLSASRNAVVLHSLVSRSRHFAGVVILQAYLAAPGCGDVGACSQGPGACGEPRSGASFPAFAGTAAASRFNLSTIGAGQCQREYM
ncbi:uncharacterized protein B0I36DRAFT_321656 [Microdochium trichocladiopsis]|uniref:Secreted protein n=1 Tax=Microdochium trichocladiopsis TaxID=1682393 RepID=A0A9P8Y9A9_9PEZI|nr:uncharacterized protein B0I36DRAFT_321656 [Microdochium trichocladiopsis]KAH7033544.1 hypothetical protein B0I36DRAFT_321656 [Microdochium trichocladiopsis]